MGRFQSFFGGTTEITKVILGRGLGLQLTRPFTTPVLPGPDTEADGKSELTLTSDNLVRTLAGAVDGVECLAEVVGEGVGGGCRARCGSSRPWRMGLTCGDTAL